MTTNLLSNFSANIKTSAANNNLSNIYPKSYTEAMT